MSNDIVSQVKAKVTIPYRWSYGGSLSRFFYETKVNKRFMGARCTKCGKVIIPAHRMCSRCFAPTDDNWIEVSDHGVLECFTVVYLPFPGQPKPPPYAYGMVRLDGADTLYPHLISEIDFDKITTNMRVQAVWNEDRKGDLYDLKHFKPEETA